ncbi:hypothetical protein G3O00_36595 [Burkholderia sp. Ac-20384]|uniref:hypothetical protein n=1 Tax=Burkholderia sp. Ac-20384 TaxID=2703902 RepID=UPI00197E206C|nr:hypothetical protein [Burkholderia sp. Ac-20384]MBN3829083.1 hypothetical protein [Burkholderia sp. Ac-20384]
MTISQDRPSRLELAAGDSDIRAEPYSAAHQEGVALLKRLPLASGTLMTLPDMNRRPQRSAGMRAVISALPGASRILAPKSPYELMTGKKGHMVETDAAMVDAFLKELTEAVGGSHARHAAAANEVETAGNTLEAARRELEAAERMLDSASASGDAARLPVLAQAVEAATQALQQAKDKLKNEMAGMRERMAGFQSLGLGVQVQTLDVLGRKIAVVSKQIDFLANTMASDELALPQVIGQLGVKLDDAEKNLRQKSEALAAARRTVKGLEKSLADARTKLKYNELADLALGEIDPSSADSSGADNAGSSLPMLKADISNLEAQLAVGRESVNALGLELDSLTFARSYLNDELMRLRGFADDAGTQLSDTAIGLRAARVEVEKTKVSVSKLFEAQQKQVDELSSSVIRAIATSAPGFAIDELANHGAPLLEMLKTMSESERLQRDDFQVDRVLPRVTAMEMISRGLAVATGGDVDLAAQLARDLTSRPLDHWVPLPAGKVGEAGMLVHEAPSKEMIALLTLMASVPRGLDAMNTVAGSAAADDAWKVPLDSGQRDAEQAYWQAYRARANEPSAQVKAWLDDAMDVAAREIRNPKGAPLLTLDAVPLKKQAAYRAVRNGFLSNAQGSDYDLCNQNLLNLTETMIAQKPRRPRLLRWAPTSVDPAKGASPFQPRVLRFAQKQMEAQGMETRKTRLDREIATTFAKLGESARGYLQNIVSTVQGDCGEDRRLSVALVALADYVTGEPRRSTRNLRFPLSAESLNLRSPIAPKRFGQTKRLYDAQFDKKDIARIRERLAELDPDANGQMPPMLDVLFDRKRVSLIDVMTGLNAALDGSSDELSAALGPALVDLRRSVTGAEPQAGSAASGAANAANVVAVGRTIGARVAEAKSLTIESKDDIDSFFRPMLETARLRDQVTLTSGGAVGIGIPMLVPVAPGFPLSGQVHLASRRSEAFLQLKNPTFSTEIVTGSVVTSQRDISVTAGYRVPFGAGGLTATGTAKLDNSHATTISTSLRTLRGKDDMGNRKVQQAIDDNLSVLDTLLRWRDKTDAHGENYGFDDPLQAVLALNPGILVASSRKESRGTQGMVEARAAVRGRALTGHLSGGASFTPLAMRAGKMSERSVEQTGYSHQTVHDNNETALQRGEMGARIGFIGTPYKHGIARKDANVKTGKGTAAGKAHISLVGNLFEYSRELFSNLEKNGATTFPIGDSMGGSVDRVYGTPKDLLAEIEAHREDWLIRCLDVLPRAKHSETDTTDRLSQANRLLDRFVADLRQAGADPGFQFNIKYEMWPRMSGLVDGLRGVEALASEQGDNAGAERARTAADELLTHRASWAPKNMTVRSKGKTSQELGIDFFLRWQKTASAETSRSAAAFPI